MAAMQASFSVHAVIVTPDLEVVTISSVGDTFQTVNLQNTYTTTIPVCTYNLPSSTAIPAVVRIQNITTNSFDVKIQRAARSGTETSGDVHCVISESGEFTVGGLHWEAGSHTPNVTASRSNFSVQAADLVTLAGTFTSPAVLHQVISTNDANWSTTWSYSDNAVNPPTASNIHVGKHIAHDTVNTTRADELLGYIVVETNNGAVNGVDFESALGADSLIGATSAPVNYSLLAPATTYRHGIASQAAMDGGDGGWAVLAGMPPMSSGSMALSIDEDTIGDTERGHTTEQAAYWVFEPVDVAELGVTLDDGSVNYTPSSTVVYTAVVTNNGPNDATGVIVSNPVPAGATISNWVCAPSGAATCTTTPQMGAIAETGLSIPNGETLTYTISVDLPSNFSGDLSNTITVDSGNFDLLTSNDTVTDVNTNNADIVVTIDDSTATYTAGGISTYTVTMSNAGPRSADDAQIIFNAPVDSSITAWTCTGLSCPALSTGSGDIDYTVASFASGDSISYSVDVTSFSSRTTNMTATVTGNALNADPVAGNNSASDIDTPVFSSDISITNTDGLFAYLPGTTVVYNVTVTNDGLSDATSVQVINGAPAGTTISAWSCVGCLITAGSGSISAIEATLVSGDSLSYIVNVAVPFSFVGNLVSTASANAIETDPNNTNNSVTDTDISSPDTDGDGVPDAIEITDGTDPNNPSDFKDSDGDGVPDLIESAEGTDPNDPLSILDSDGDNTSDYIERGGDKDSDGIGDEFESSITDTDGNNIKDDLDDDADGDGTPDITEGLVDTDGDGIPDFLDIVNGASPMGGNSDGDGIADAKECVAYPLCADTDGDSIPNYADNDDDNDGLLTSAELGPGGGVSPDDSDGDTVFDYLEPNNIDTNANTIFNHLDADDDGDGIATVDELDADGDLSGDALDPDDLDNEGIPDYLDADNGDGSGADITGSGDSDGDGMSDAQECPAAPMCADSDGDGIPNYMIANTDSDGDGILDAVEIGSDPANPIDSDADGVPDYLEDNTLDTDADGVLNILDADDDGDNIPTSQELGSGGALNPADSDADGVPDYLSVTTIQTGLDGGAGAINPLHVIVMLLVTMIRARCKSKL